MPKSSHAFPEAAQLRFAADAFLAFARAAQLKPGTLGGPGLRVVVQSSDASFPLPGRFWRWFLGSVIAIAFLAGSGSALQAAWGLRKFGGLEYVPRVATLSALREIAPGTGSGAAVVAMIAWAQQVGIPMVALHKRGLYARSLVAALLAFPIATVIALASSLATLQLYNVSVGQFVNTAWEIVQLSDLAAGIGLTVLDVTVVLTVAWFGLLPLTRTVLKLPAKILVAWLAVMLAKVLVAGVFALAA